MAAKSLADIQADIQRRRFAPLYLLQGEEPYFIDQLTELLEKSVLPESERSFNQTVLYGKDVSVEDIIACARRYPMMSEYQVVILREAQGIHANKIEELTTYTDSPLGSTIFVMALKNKSLDKRKKLYKSFSNNGVIFQSEKIRDDKMPAWIGQFVKNQGFKINEETCFFLKECLGNNLERVVNELNKLAINLQPGSDITRQQIETFIGINKDFNLFELQNAIGRKDLLKAYQIIRYFNEYPKGNDYSVHGLIGLLYGYFNKLLIYHSLKGLSDQEIGSAMGINTYFLKDYQQAVRHYNVPRLKRAIRILLEFNLKINGIGTAYTTEEELSQELIYKLTQ